MEGIRTLPPVPRGGTPVLLLLGVEPTMPRSATATAMRHAIARTLEAYGTYAVVCGEQLWPSGADALRVFVSPETAAAAAAGDISSRVRTAAGAAAAHHGGHAVYVDDVRVPRTGDAFADAAFELRAWNEVVGVVQELLLRAHQRDAPRETARGSTADALAELSLGQRPSAAAAPAAGAPPQPPPCVLSPRPPPASPPRCGCACGGFHDDPRDGVGGGGRRLRQVLLGVARRLGAADALGGARARAAFSAIGAPGTLSGALGAALTHPAVAGLKLAATRAPAEEPLSASDERGTRVLLDLLALDSSSPRVRELVAARAAAAFAAAAPTLLLRHVTICAAPPHALAVIESYPQ